VEHVDRKNEIERAVVERQTRRIGNLQERPDFEIKRMEEIVEILKNV